MNNYYNYLYQNQYESPAITPYLGIENAKVIDIHNGFIRGNLFANLYKPYLSLEPFKLHPKNERESMLDNVRASSFALTDLNLYLDNHPDDAEKIKLYNEIKYQHHHFVEEYERKFGPLSLDSDVLDSYPWAWLKAPWPWEVK